MMYVNIISVKATGIKYGGWICVKYQLKLILQIFY